MLTSILLKKGEIMTLLIALFGVLLLLNGCVGENETSNCKCIAEDNDNSISAVTLMPKEVIVPEVRGCPKSLLNARGVLFYSNLGGEGVIYQPNTPTKYLGCVLYDPRNEVIVNTCNVTLTIEYCFMRKK